VNFATNTLAPFVLTEMLLPLLAAATPRGRVVAVSSGGQYTEELLLEDMQWLGPGFDGARAYARDKRRQTALTAHWAEAHRESGVFFSSMHPGWADTDAVRTSLPQFYEALKARLRSPEEGADTVVWLCCVAREKVQPHSGAFFFDRRPVDAHLPLSWTQFPPQRAAQLADALRELAAQATAKAEADAAAAATPGADAGAAAVATPAAADAAAAGTPPA
jgi:dehydrogenase/reductase SDR family protein 12